MVFSPMLLLQTLASSLIICLVGLQITTASIIYVNCFKIYHITNLFLNDNLSIGINRTI